MNNITPFPANAGEKQGGRFQKGQSGNPKGKPRGARHRTTLAAQELLAGEAEALTRKAVSLALNGDTVALRLCLDRILPIVRERPLLPLDLPVVRSKADLATLHETLLHHVSEGTLTLTEATALFDFAATGLDTSNSRVGQFAETIARALQQSPEAGL